MMLQKINVQKNKLFKINYVIETILNKSNELYSPEQYLSIDESMIKYNGKN